VFFIDKVSKLKGKDRQVTVKKEVVITTETETKQIKPVASLSEIQSYVFRILKDSTT
jgi:hypothetical protein